MAATAPFCMSLNTCELVSIAWVIVECPNISCTTFRCSPLGSKGVAHACLRWWIVIQGGPVRSKSG